MLEDTLSRSRLVCDARRKVGQWASGSVNAFLSWFSPHYLREKRAFVMFQESILFFPPQGKFPLAFLFSFWIIIQKSLCHYGEAKKLTIRPREGEKKQNKNTFRLLSTVSPPSSSLLWAGSLVGVPPWVCREAGPQRLPPETPICGNCFPLLRLERTSAGGGKRRLSDRVRCTHLLITSPELILVIMTMAHGARIRNPKTPSEKIDE